MAGLLDWLLGGSRNEAKIGLLRQPGNAASGPAQPVFICCFGVRWSLRTLAAGALADCCLRCRLMVVVLGWWPAGAAGPASGGGRECWPAGGLGRADAETESCEAAGGLVRWLGGPAEAPRRCGACLGRPGVSVCVFFPTFPPLFRAPSAARHWPVSPRFCRRVWFGGADARPGVWCGWRLRSQVERTAWGRGRQRAAARRPSEPAGAAGGWRGR